MVAYQGKFDGLCGMYAIVNAYEINAYEICDYGGICEELFQVACGGAGSPEMAYGSMGRNDVWGYDENDPCVPKLHKALL